MKPPRATRLHGLADRWWELIAPLYDPAVALTGWHRRQDALLHDVFRGLVLDVGCGPAHLAGGLRGRPVRYVGTDKSAAMVRRASVRVASTGAAGAIVRADVTALPFADESFDVVIAAGVLGLLGASSRCVALGEMARVARAEVRLLEPVHRPGAPTRTTRSRLIALLRDHPIELAELTAVGLEAQVSGPPALAGVYTMVRARKSGSGRPAGAADRSQAY